MLLIYDYLVDVLKQHIDERKIKAKIKPCIGRAWHRYRYIQVILDSVPDFIHYEYINGHWELHFENTCDDTVNAFRRKVISNINSDGYLNWHRCGGYQRGYLNIEEIVEEEKTFLEIFDKLWDATSPFLLENTDNRESSAHKPEDSTVNNKRLNSREYLDNLINFNYKEPDVRIASIEDLPFELFVIPPYQRPYKWGAKNVNQFINDVITFCEKGANEYRFGTLVLHKQGDDVNSPLNIVDGQQRIITLMLLLNELQKEQRDLFKGIEICSFLEKQQFHEKISYKNILENINTIRYRLQEFHKKHIRFLLSNCKFIIITLHDISEAFQFFDSQNSRGKNLEPHDLLKAFHLREIPQMSENDKFNVYEWEKQDTPILSNLFLVLFRIKRWIDGNNGREFTSNNVNTFKGPKREKNILPYQKIYAIAECYTKLYNTDLSRKIDHQHMDYPHQIDQTTINGTLFFDMVRYYSKKVIIVKDLLSKHCKDIAVAIDSYSERNRIGDLYTHNLFTTALLYYYDKFSEEGFKNAVPKIFAWAYSMRIKHYSVQLATMDNFAREDNSFFRILHRAISPSDIQNWVIMPIQQNENKQQGKMTEIINILIKYNYIYNNDEQ